MRVHRWSGLTIMALLAVAGATGGVLAFRDSIERRLNPHLRVVTPAPARAALQDVIDGVETRFAGARVSTVTLPSRPDGSMIAYLSGRPDVSQVFINPSTGEILGQRPAGRIVFSREYLIPVLLRLHYSLLLGAAGVWIMGAAAIVWLLTSVIGLALAWPAGWRGGAGRKPLHVALGVFLLPIWIVLAFTSIYLSFPNAVRAATSVLSPVITAPIPASREAGGPIVTPDIAVEHALAAVPSAKAFGFTRDFANRRYSVRLMLPDDVNPAGNSQAYIDFATGRVTAVRLASAVPAGLGFLYWQFPLHSGEALGAPGRIVIALSAVALVATCATGLSVWLRGRRTRR